MTQQYEQYLLRLLLVEKLLIHWIEKLVADYFLCLNLAYYQNLMLSIRKEINNSTFNDWSQTTLKEMQNMKGM